MAAASAGRCVTTAARSPIPARSISRRSRRTGSRSGDSAAATVRPAPAISNADGQRPSVQPPAPSPRRRYTYAHFIHMTAPRLTPIQWLICAIASLGFAFDIYEVLMAPLVVGPAIGELTGAKPGTPEFNYWVGLFFWVPALVGGGFGLIGGYLTDRYGRRRVLVWSILLYAFSALAAGFSTNVVMLLVLRSTTYIGVFVEFVAAVAWVAELFNDAKQREKALGYTQAFSSIGGVMVTGAYAFAVTYGPSLPAINGGHASWRYTLISGVIPALPLIVIRPFLPESPAWQQKKA